ncbi:phosphoenolpyruvate--protein phosphotransferase [Conexibacter stalactiti]|uniref:Phosphocarrier protein HPr n=1 Tax=Conexibacter stalactiti TaxID=1940611 RepID=A0ABU4HYD2_9ACTN|nr:phosphoenolpyruvate--protein phosphotransferase [Conexibacter stalactiti]MDW5597712.1 phosphoenolpyruvate--protein phosphotransferase [Conexibacter stalactiti]MEC5038354.1 phosphoenolpyruvate--protein phosphotransferase [Conexibacter stalactiti]
MVGLVVVSHSARLAAGVAELAREMGGEVRLETAGGLEPPGEGEEAPLGTDATRVMSAIEAADDGSGDGVLVLMDLGSAVLSAEMAVELLDPALGEQVRLVAAPLVEGAVAAAVSAAGGASLDAVADEARGGLAGKAAHLGEAEGAGAAPPHAPAPPDDRRSVHPGDAQTATPPSDTVEERFAVTVSQGLHARPAARFVRTAAALSAQIEVENATTGAGPAPAGSLNAIATLGVREGHELIVRATGPDARLAVQRLREVATGGGGDAKPEVPPAPRPPPGAPPSSRPLPPGAPAGALAGIPSSPGIALGPLRRLGGEDEEELPPILDEPGGSPEEEWAVLADARATVREEVGRRRERLAREVGPEEAEILDALALVLDDGALLGPARQAIDAGRSAGRAWADAIEAIADRYRALDDPYQRERAGDVLDVGRRVLRELAADRGTPDADRGTPDANRGAAAADSGAPDAGSSRGSGRAIVVARDLTPIDAAGLDRATVAGIATAEGGPTSHGAILARALGVPAVVGLGAALLALVAPGAAAAETADAGTAGAGEVAGEASEQVAATAILDGDTGLLIPAPDPDTQRDYRDRQARAAALAEQARAAAHDPATTRDGVTVEVAANAGAPADAAEGRAAGADGVGLFRTEFAFLHRAAAPTEEEQLQIYAQAAAALDGRPLVIRTLDAGADKPLPYLGMPAEANPFLGVRGLRLGLARPELLSTQLRAIARTAAAHDNVKLMFPMVATIDELRTARTLLQQAIEQTRTTPRDGFEVGIMIEVPAAALTAVQLAHEVDFFSLGTNDLTQYVLAAERGNAALAALADGLHPAVLRLVDEVCRAARAHGRWVGVCGELAADPVAAPLLVGLGVRELSVAAPSVAAVKQAVRALDADEAAALAHAALAAESADAVRTLVVSDDGPTGRR